MSRYCRTCQERYAADATVCPSCGQPAAEPTEEAAPPHEGANGSAEIDLGGPVFGGGEDAGPGSGASFVSWAARLDRKNKAVGTPPQVPRADTARADSSATIDLGSPVTNAVGPSGPPSGASFVAWSSLLPRRKALGDASFHPETPPAGPGSSAANKAPWDRVRWLLAGVVLGVVLCVGLWSLGYEPPQVLRRLVGAPPTQPNSP